METVKKPKLTVLCSLIGPLLFIVIIGDLDQFFPSGYLN